MTLDNLDTLPVVDKHRLIGACVRLRIEVDISRLKSEVLALPATLWGSRGGRGGVHDRADAIFLRGYAPADRGMPLVDRPPLDMLPTAREFITQTVPAPPMRCVLARLAPATCIPAHADTGRYFERTVRLHVPVVTNPKVVMFAEGNCYRMVPGEVWALNNAGTHGVINDDPHNARIHLICDFVPTPGLVDLIAAGEAELGVKDPQTMRRFREMFEAGVPAPTTAR